MTRYAELTRRWGFLMTLCAPLLLALSAAGEGANHADETTVYHAEGAKRVLVAGCRRLTSTEGMTMMTLAEARAKGLPPGKAMRKYPLRMALNFFIADIGGILPTIVSGAEIVAIVLSLAAAFSISANTLSGGIVTPRMTYAMAEQGLLPRFFIYYLHQFLSRYSLPAASRTLSPWSAPIIFLSHPPNL